MNYLLFTTTTCPKCPEVKKFVTENFRFSGRTVDNSQPEFLTDALKYGVGQAPTLIVFDDSGAELFRGSDLSEIAYWHQTLS